MSDRIRIKRRSFGLHVIETAKFFAAEIRAKRVPLFQEVDRRWLGLSFPKSVGAAVLAEALAMKPRGSA